MVEKLKNFIHKHRTLEKIVLFAWGIYYIVRAKLVFRKIKYNIAKKAKPKVLILALRTIPTTNLVYFDAIFGHAFRKLDCDVKMLYCDGLLDSCDGETVSRDQKPQCFVCKKFNKLLKGTLGLDWLSFFQYISEKDIEKIKEEVANLNKEELLNYQYLGVKVGVHAQSSAIRYFLSGMIDLNDPRQIAVVREKLVSAMITTKISDEINKKEKPNAIFLLHGIYSTWGPFRDYFFSQENVETVLYGNMPPRFGHFIFNRNNKLNEIVSKEEWSNFSHLSLTKEEEKEIDDYFTNRSKGTIGDQKMYENNFGTKLGGKPLLKSLLGKKYSKRYVMYTNLAWDVAIEGKVSKIFDDVFSWIDTTLEFFKQKKDYQLIIKPHPAELVWEKCSMGIWDYINEKYNSLPENIIVLKPDIPLRAYDLIDNNTIGIVFNGTLGLELSALGVPVLVTADIHYKDAGVVYKVETLKDYLSLLDNPDELISFTKDNAKLAKKYAYFYFFKSMIRIPFYRDDKWSTIDWKILSNPEKLLDENGNIMKICKKIINKEDIITPL